ncbi:uncharacterized protein PG998_004108 [Apiospora kogelbergensis]|uniref:uncharacterized protein n=1 Tax=Apiospora kogelbergensis TaxID=1337665 RepID=UPI00312DB82A
MKAFISQLRRPGASSSTTSSHSSLKYPSLVNGLPVELHLQIVSYLTHDDVIACLHTSHSLRHIWESPSIWPTLADRWYPGLSTQLRLTVPVSQCGAAFRSFLARNRRRSRGRFLSSLHHSMRLEDDEYFTTPLSRALPVAQGAVHEYAAVPDLSSSSSSSSFSTATNAVGREATEGGAGRGHEYTRLAHFVAYANGRIAWWPEAYSLPYFAIVDDLRTRRRRGYLFPGHDKDRRGYMTSLGDTMLLMARGTTLHAWNFADDRGGTASTAESLRSVEMPQRIARTLCENETVLIVSQNGEVWLWRPRFHDGQPKEEPPRKIDITRAHCYVPGHVLSDRYDIRDVAYRACRVGLRIQQPSPPPVDPSSFISDQDGLEQAQQTLAMASRNNNNINSVITLDLVLHPARRDIFFLATLQDRTLTIYEFSTDGTLLDTYHPAFPSPTLHMSGSPSAPSSPSGTSIAEQSPNHLLPPRWAAHRGGLRWEKTSAHGDFSLLPVWLGGQQTNGPFDATGASAAVGAPVICPQCRDAGFVAVCFNVYTKAFTYPCFETTAAHHDLRSNSLEAFRLWNGRLTERLSAATAEEDEWPLMTRGRKDDHPLVACRRELSLQSHWGRWHALSLDSQKRLRRTVEFALDPDQAFAENRVQRQGSNPTPSLGVQSLWGDDEFLIYMNDQVYTTWRFSG